MQPHIAITTSLIHTYLIPEITIGTENKAFKSWGYTIADARWPKTEIERQAQEKYVIGDDTLGVLDRYGQRISIRIELPRKDRSEDVSVLTGWTVCPNGQMRLNTPYGENKMRYMDCVEVVVEKSQYASHGVHRGMQGWICDERNY